MGKRTVEVKAEAEERYVEMIHREMGGTVWHAGGRTSGYESRRGRVIAMFPWFRFSYAQMARRVRRADHVLA